MFSVSISMTKNSKLAFFSNKGSKPTRVPLIKNGENIDRKFGYFELGRTSKFEET